MTEKDPFQEKLECMFAEIGAQLGDIFRCMVQQEMAAHIARIKELQAVLNGVACQPSTEVSGEAKPTA